MKFNEINLFAFYGAPIVVMLGSQDFVARVFTNPVTRAGRRPMRFEVGDRVAAYVSGLTGLGGGDLAAQRAQTVVANERLPPEAKLAASMTGYGPFAAQGIASGIGGVAAQALPKYATRNASAFPRRRSSPCACMGPRQDGVRPGARRDRRRVVLA